MKQTPKHKIKYPEGTDLVRNASTQFEAMAQSIDDNIDDLPAEITAKVTAAQSAAEAAAATAEKYGRGTRALQDDAVATLIADTTTKTHEAIHPTRLMLAFGDSITVGQQSGVTNNWVTQLASTLDLDVRSYAVNGSAFYGQRSGIMSIPEQADQMLADNSLNRSRVSMIVVGGGYNDAHDDAATTDASHAGAASWLAKIRATFPSTPIIAVIGLGCPDYGTNLLLKRSLPFYLAIREAMDGNLVQVAFGWQFLYGYGEEYWLRRWDNSPYDAHPSQKGHDVIATRLVQLLHGGQQLTMPMPEQSQTFVASDNSTHVKWIIDPQAKLFSMLVPKSITVTLSPLDGLGARLRVTMEWNALDNTGGQPVLFGYLVSNRWLTTGLAKTVTVVAAENGKTLTFPATLHVINNMLYISVPAHGSDQTMQNATAIIDITIDYQAGK